MDITVLINRHFEALNENEKYIANYILNHTEACQSMSITELAEKTLTSKSSILRFTQKLGFSGFSEFKYSIKSQSSNAQVTRDLFQHFEDDFMQTTKLFNQQDLKPILSLFHKAERIYMYGTGWGQRNVLTTFCRSLVPIGKFPVVIESQKELELSLSSMTERDFVIILSLSGNTKPKTDLLQEIKLKQIPILSITELSSNRLANLADYNLFFQSTAAAIPVENSYSLLSMFQIMDMFNRAYVSEYSKNEEDAE